MSVSDDLEEKRNVLFKFLAQHLQLSGAESIVACLSDAPCRTRNSTKHKATSSSAHNWSNT
jgi:hypothetical protein